MARIFKPSKPALPGPTELKITALSTDCEGIAYHQNKTVFVAGALPGERVGVSFTGATKGSLQARIAVRNESSADRAELACEYANRCGGCDFMHVLAERQIELKQALVLDKLAQQAGLVPVEVAAPIRSDPWHYRSKARLATWRGKDNRWYLGYREGGSKQVVNIDHCPVLVPRLDRLLQPLQNWLARASADCRLGHLDLFSSDGCIGVLMRLLAPLPAGDFDSLHALAEQEAFDLWLHLDQPELISPEQTPNPAYSYRLPSKNVQLSFKPWDFTQVNQKVNVDMVGQAMAWLETGVAIESRRLALDLYCGIGNFTLPLASMFCRVIGVELFDEMVVRGRANAQQNGIENALFVGADLALEASKAAFRDLEIDAAVLDPPRAGAHGVIQFLSEKRVPKLLYVSCNPATLVRDAKQLAMAGYKLHRFGAVDMFPNTKHTETMSLFTL